MTTQRTLPEIVKEKNRLIWGHVRSEDDLNKAIIMIADGTEEAVNNIYEQFVAMSVQNASVTKAVFGNGTPEESIVVRMKVVETDLKTIKDGFSKLAWGVAIPVAIAVVWAIIKLIANGI